MLCGSMRAGQNLLATLPVVYSRRFSTITYTLTTTIKTETSELPSDHAPSESISRIGRRYKSAEPKGQVKLKDKIKLENVKHKIEVKPLILKPVRFEVKIEPTFKVEDEQNPEPENKHVRRAKGQNLVPCKTARQIEKEQAKTAKNEDPAVLTPERLRLISAITNYDFKNHEYITEALQNLVNKRLAMVGDRILDLALMDVWYPGSSLSPGAFHVMRGVIVSNKNLADIGRRLGLKSMVVTKGGNEITSVAGISTAVEAIIGAVYMDGGVAEAAKVIKTFGLIENLMSKMAEVITSQAEASRASRASQMENSGVDASQVVRFQVDASQVDQSSHNHKLGKKARNRRNRKLRLEAARRALEPEEGLQE